MVPRAVRQNPMNAPKPRAIAEMLVDMLGRMAAERSPEMTAEAKREEEIGAIAVVLEEILRPRQAEDAFAKAGVYNAEAGRRLTPKPGWKGR
jgi:hypothetical protein